MTDVADELYRIINDLPGLEYGLQLGAFVLVHQYYCYALFRQFGQRLGCCVKPFD